MLTNKPNLLKAIRKMYYPSLTSGSVDFSDFPLKATDGTVITSLGPFTSTSGYSSRDQSYILSNDVLVAINNNSAPLFLFGSSDNPVDSSDYTIDTIIQLQVNYANVEVTSNGVIRVWGHLTNTQNQDITIKEVGRTVYLYNSGSKRVLVERTVLPSPITLHPGDVFTFTYDIKPEG